MKWRNIILNQKESDMLDRYKVNQSKHNLPVLHFASIFAAIVQFGSKFAVNKLFQEMFRSEVYIAEECDRLIRFSGGVPPSGSGYDPAAVT